MTDRSWELRTGRVAQAVASPTQPRATWGRTLPVTRAGSLAPAIDAPPMAQVAATPNVRTWARETLPVVVPAGAISGLIVLGLATGIGSLSLIGAALALGAAIVAPEVGLAVLACLSPLQPPQNIPAPGLNLLLAGAIVLGCVGRLPIDRPALRLSKAGLFLLGFVVYIAAQQLPVMLGGYQGDDGHTVGYLFFQVLTGFLTVIGAGYLFKTRSPIPVLIMALIGAAIATIVAVATFENPETGPLARLVATTDLGVRAAGPFSNPNYMGMFGAAVVVGILAVWTIVRSRSARALLLALLVLSVISIVEAQSRGAIIAAFAGVTVLMWLRNRQLAVAFVVVGLVGAAFVYPAFIEWRLTNLQGGVSDAGYSELFKSDDARLNASLAGPTLFLSDPIFGVGFGEFVEKSVTIARLDTGINAHNWYVNTLAEQGITGALLWAGMTIATFLQLLPRRGVARAVGLGTLAVLVVGMNFLEAPLSFQLVAIPSLFLVAALVSTWPDGRAAAGTAATATGTATGSEPDLGGLGVPKGATV